MVMRLMNENQLIVGRGNHAWAMFRVTRTCHRPEKWSQSFAVGLDRRGGREGGIRPSRPLPPQKENSIRKNRRSEGPSLPPLSRGRRKPLCLFFGRGIKDFPERPGLTKSLALNSKRCQILILLNIYFGVFFSPRTENSLKFNLWDSTKRGENRLSVLFFCACERLAHYGRKPVFKRLREQPEEVARLVTATALGSVKIPVRQYVLISRFFSKRRNCARVAFSVGMCTAFFFCRGELHSQNCSLLLRFHLRPVRERGGDFHRKLIVGNAMRQILWIRLFRLRN